MPSTSIGFYHMDDMAQTSSTTTFAPSSWMFAFGKVGRDLLQAALVVDIDVGRVINQRLFAFQVSRRMW